MKPKDWDELRARTQDPAWAETLTLMFEQVPNVRLADHTAEAMFGKAGGKLSKEGAQKAVNAWGLLAGVAMNTAVRLGVEAREALIAGAWETLLSDAVQESVWWGVDIRPLANPLWSETFHSLQTFARLATGRTRLRLAGDRVIDLAPIAGLKALETLNLDNTQVADLAPIAGLKTLKTLSLTTPR